MFEPYQDANGYVKVMMAIELHACMGQTIIEHHYALQNSIALKKQCVSVTKRKPMN